MFSLLKPSRLFLACEATLLFVVLPLVLFMHPTRMNVHASLWLAAGYAAWILHHTPGFSWRQAWQGSAFSKHDFLIVVARFVVATIGIILLTMLIKPERLFGFPREKPIFWLVIMVLYPILSALPQELVFRTFFFRRYADLFPSNKVMLAASAAVFGFIHIVFHNPVSPLLSVFCGFFLAASYLAHGSLKRVALEHALYGDMVFTVGLGYYFLVGYSG